MLKTICRRAVGLAGAFLAAQQGSILIYTGAFMAIGVGSAALSIDIGRIVLLRTQMQNRADAGALAGAAQLDALPGAIARADDVVRDSMKAYTTAGADGTVLAVLNVTFHEAEADGITRQAAETTDDNAARFVVVDLERRTLSFFYGPAAAAISGKTADSLTVLDARAIGMSDPYVCKAQPLMMCNPYEGIPGDLKDQSGIGLRIKQSGKSQPWAPGNFGLLDLPGDAGYTCGGANCVEVALSAEEPDGCYAVSSLGTAPGNKTGKVKEGVNVRFGMDVTDATVKPAPNVMSYPLDDVMYSDTTRNFGDGVWDWATYWSTHHSGQTLPTELEGGSRYQFYLYEIGESFWVRNKKETSTHVGEPDPGLKGPWKQIIPPGPSIPTDPLDPHNTWVDGLPPTPEYGQGSQTESSIGYKRRVLKVAVINCGNPPTFKGNATIPGNGTFVEIFLTNEAGNVPPDTSATIYGELIGTVDAKTSLEFHGNVRLVE